MSNRKLDPGIFLIGLMALVVIVAGIYIYNQVRTDEISSRTQQGKEIAVLFVVEDQGKLLISNVLLLHSKTNRLVMIDVPANLFSVFGSPERHDSIETLYAEQGIEGYQAYISKFLDIPISLYLKVSLQDIEKLTDLYGGLEIFLPDSIDAKQENGKLIRIPNGTILLDGDKIRDYLLFEGANEREQEKTNRKWSFTKAFLIATGKMSKYLNRGTIGTFFNRYMTGNLDDRALSTFSSMLSKTKFDIMVNHKVFGSTKSIEIAGKPKNLLIPTRDGIVEKDFVRQVIDSLSSNDVGGSTGPVKIEILNGTDFPGLAKKAKEIYQNAGNEVIRFGNSTNTNIAKTEIIDRKGNQALVERIAKFIRCENISSQIVAQSGDPNTDVDVTIILGKDFDGVYVKK